jgi:hypothetical protein
VPDELGKGAAFDAPAVGSRQLADRCFHDLDLHLTNLAESALVSPLDSVLRVRLVRTTRHHTGFSACARGYRWMRSGDRAGP